MSLDIDKILHLDGSKDRKFIRRSPSVIKLKGSEVLEFLQRISTNDLLDLTVDTHRTTILTNEKGRIIDIVSVLRSGDEILLIGSEGTGTVLKGWLERFIIMEDIQVSDCTADFVIFSIFGFAVNPLTPGDEKNRSDSAHLVVDKTIEGSHLRYFKPDLWRGTLAYLLLYPEKEKREIPEPSLIVSGSHYLAAASQGDYELFRIESGIPAIGHEITPEFNPLEIGLQPFISFTKGCYIGQEVIARLETYKKVQKRMVGVIIGPHDPHDSYLGKLYVKGELVGYTTSFCYSPSLKSVIALGFIQAGVFAPGADLHRSGKPPLSVKFSKFPFH